MNPRRNPTRERRLKLALRCYLAEMRIVAVEFNDDEGGRVRDDAKTMVVERALAAIYAAFSPQPKAPATDD